MPISRTCEVCSRPFTVDPYRAATAHVCSRECQHEWQSRYRRGPANHAYQESVLLSCDKCGKQFAAKPKEAQSRRYCSKQCAGISRDSRITIECPQCHKPFTTTPALLVRGRRFCSRRCMFGFKGQSVLEQLLASETQKRGLTFVPQFHVASGNPKGWWLDIAIPGCRIAIEADGKYWHDLPEIRAKDARRDADLAARGWTVLHFAEHEIRESPAKCIDRVQACIAERAKST